MKKRFLLLLASLALGTAVANASSVTLTFTGLGDEEAIDNYYNGGLGGNGSGPGPNYGIAFSSDSLAIISEADGGSGNFDNVPPPASTTIAFFLNGAGDTMDVAAGFDTGFSFYYSATQEGSVSVYSGLDGTGTLLATLSLDPNDDTSCDSSPYTYTCWTNTGVAFGGTAESVIFSGAANFIGFADITLGASSVPPPSTPEPGGLVLLGSSLFGAAGMMLRRRRRA